MEPSTRHYHILSGLHGYMPNINEIHSSLRETERSMAHLIEQYREDGARFNGSASKHYAECNNPRETGLEYIEIIECYEDCKKRIENDF